MKVGAPLFASFAKGGHDAACSADVDIAGTSRHAPWLAQPKIHAPKVTPEGAPSKLRLGGVFL